MKIIHVIEYVIAKIFWICGITNIILFLNKKLGNVPIIMYHSIQAKPINTNKIPMVWQTGMAVSPDTFEEQIKEISKQYKCITVQEYLEHIELKKKENVLVITFDDGYVNNYDTVLPILIKYRVNATFFLIGCHLTKERPAPIFLYNILSDNMSKEKLSKIFNNISRFELVHSGLELLQKYNYNEIKNDFKYNWNLDFVSIDQSKEMIRKGFEIGAHGYYHLITSSLKDTEFVKDIIKSKKTITAVNNQNKVGFAYPYGSTLNISESNKQYLLNAGFSYSVTTREGTNSSSTDRYYLKRIAMDEVPLHETMFRLTGVRGIAKHFYNFLRNNLLRNHHKTI